MRTSIFRLKKFINPQLLRIEKIAFQNHARTLISDTENEKLSGKLVPFSQEDANEFMSYFPLIVEDLTKNQRLHEIEEITKRFSFCLESTVPNGKRVRGLTTVIAYKLLENPENLTKENIRLANILGWCTELVEAAVIVYDDLMDNSLTRRNGPCWHRRDGVGLVAISDAIGLNTSAYIILKKYFSTHPLYTEIFEFFHSIMYHTAFGQTMDSIRYAPEDINMKKFKTIAKYKTGFYTFYYPVVLGMFLSKKYDQELLDNKIAPILFDMGEFFQIKNDYNDCFAELNVTGKAGTDIEESKCTWLAAKALEKCSPSQRKLFEENYGKPEKNAIKTIRNLYVELGLKEDYEYYENHFFESLRDKSQQLERPYYDVVKVLIDKLEKQVYKSL